MSYQQIFTIENTRCATSGTGTAYPSRSPRGNNCLSFGHYIVCPSIYGFWLLFRIV